MKRFINDFSIISQTELIIQILSPTVKENPRQNPLPRQMPRFLLLSERLTVSTLIHGGVHLMGTHHNAVQRAVVLIFTMMRTLLNGTLDTLVGTIHLIFLLCLISCLV